MSTARRFPRVAIVLEVNLHFDDLADASRGQTLNVSRQGVFIAMDDPVAVGTRVRLRIEIAGSGEQHGGEGLVIRRQPDPDDPATPTSPRGIAVFLTSADPGWSRWCDALAKTAGKPTPPDSDP
jgi:hypothetical protein